jgi:hypothetical protein
MDRASYKNFITEYTEIIVPQLPINGCDLQESGFIANQIHDGLEVAKHEWIISNFTITKDDLLKIIHNRVIR